MLTPFEKVQMKKTETKWNPSELIQITQKNLPNNSMVCDPFVPFSFFYAKKQRPRLTIYAY